MIQLSGRSPPQALFQTHLTAYDMRLYDRIFIETLTVLTVIAVAGPIATIKFIDVVCFAVDFHEKWATSAAGITSNSFYVYFLRLKQMESMYFFRTFDAYVEKPRLSVFDIWHNDATTNLANYVIKW